MNQCRLDSKKQTSTSLSLTVTLSEVEGCLILPFVEDLT